MLKAILFDIINILKFIILQTLVLNFFLFQIRDSEQNLKQEYDLAVNKFIIDLQDL